MSAPAGPLSSSSPSFLEGAEPLPMGGSVLSGLIGSTLTPSVRLCSICRRALPPTADCKIKSQREA